MADNLVRVWDTKMHHACALLSGSLWPVKQHSGLEGGGIRVTRSYTKFAFNCEVVRTWAVVAEPSKERVKRHNPKLFQTKGRQNSKTDHTGQ